MTRLNERIQTPLPIEDAFAYLADFANSEEWDPGVATVGTHRRRRGRCRNAVPPRRPTGRSRRRRWSTASRSSSRRGGSSWSGADRASRRPTTSGSSANAARDDRRLHRRHQPHRHPAPGAAIHGGDLPQDRRGRIGRNRAHARGASRIGSRADRHEDRHRRVRHQRAHRGTRPASGRSPGPPLRGRGGGGRPREDGRGRDSPRDRSGIDTGSSSTTSGPIRASSACLPISGSRRSQATCRWAPRVDHATSSGALAACAATSLRPTSLVRPAHWGMLNDLLRFYRDARDAARRPGAGRAVDDSLGGFLDDAAMARLSGSTSSCRSRRPSGRPRRPDPRLSRRLPAPLPRPSRSHRVRQRPPMAHRDGGSMRYVERLLARLPPAACGQATRWSTSAEAPREHDRAHRLGADASDSTPSCSRRTPTTPCRCSMTPMPASGRRLAASTTRPTTSCCTPTGGCCLGGTRRALRGTSTSPTAGSRRAAHHDVPHEPPPGAQRAPVEYCTSVNPDRDLLDPATIIAERTMRHPLYTFRTLEAQAALGALQGWRGTWYAGAHLGLWVPRGRLPIRLRRRRDDRGARRGDGGVRSHLLEGVVRHRRAHPFTYELEHDVFYVALDLDELDEVPRRVRLDRAQPAEPAQLPRCAITSIRRPMTSRASVLEHLRDARERTRPVGRSRSSRTFASSGTSSTRPASSCAATPEGVLRVVIVEVHNTHGERHLYTLRPEMAGGQTFVSSMEKAFYVSPFIDPVGSYTVRVRDEAGRLRITINESKDGQLQLHASIDLARRRLTSRSVAADAAALSARDAQDDRHDPSHALRLWRRGARFHRHGRPPHDGAAGGTSSRIRRAAPCPGGDARADRSSLPHARRPAGVTLPDGTHRAFGDPAFGRPSRDRRARRRRPGADAHRRRDRRRRGLRRWTVVIAGRDRGHPAWPPATAMPCALSTGLAARSRPAAAHDRPSASTQHARQRATEHQRALRPRQRLLPALAGRVADLLECRLRHAWPIPGRCAAQQVPPHRRGSRDRCGTSTSWRSGRAGAASRSTPPASSAAA